jgi:AmmeMemoRadiSam system protein B
MAIRRSITFITLMVCVLSLFPGILTAAEKAGERVRAPILAGEWYPANPDRLAQTIQGYLANAKGDQLSGEVKALIVPHAGHIYSGHVAAHAYRLLQDKHFTKVIMVGPSHHIGFAGASVNLQPGYETPLGIIPVDQELGRRIIDADKAISWLPQAHAREHSLEIQLPFLQVVLRDFQIVPILMGRQDFRTSSMLAQSLTRVLKQMDNTLILASTDLSHFHSYDRAKELDRAFTKRVLALDPRGLSNALSAGECEACGGGPTTAVLLAAQALGADRAVILKYANSGDVTGDHRRVVGYLSAALLMNR